MSTYKIDDLFFISLKTEDPAGPPIIRQRRGQIITRPGVDDAAFLRTGTRGRPFRMRSIVDLSDSTTATAALEAYTAKVLTAKYDIVFDGVSFATAHGTKYVVLSVDPVRRQRMSVSAGGRAGSGANRYLLECDWELMPVSSS